MSALAVRMPAEPLALLGAQPALKLVHYSAEPVPPLEPVRPSDQPHGPKPFGLWLSVENDPETSWRGWCEAEGFRLEHLVVATPFEITTGSRVLHLSSASDIDAFTSEYRVPDRWSRSHAIDWPVVTGRYDGIVVAPYVWARRLDGDAGWYYGWDCASGCVWNTDILVRREAE